MAKKKTSKEVDPDKSMGFTSIEQKKIVEMVQEAVDSDVDLLKEWQEEKARDLQRAMGKKPSEVQGLKKKSWMSDRDIGLCGAICDATRSTTLARTANADMLTVTPTEDNDIDRSKNVERFMKWAISDPKKKFQNVALGAITNTVQTGIAFLKIGWKRESKYINERTVDEKGNVSYEYGKKVIHEDGFIENVADVDDILCPDYGEDINDLDHFIVINHMTVADLEAYKERGQFINVTDDLKKANKGKVNEQGIDSQKGVKDEQQGIIPQSREKESASNVDIYEYYGYYKKNGKNEKYRFYVELETATFLGGKPLRDIVPSARLPYVAVPFDIIPGRIRSLSLIKKTKDITDQINCIYNQNTDYQTIQNNPAFVGSSSDTKIKGRTEVSPGDFVKSGDPSNVRALTHQASFSWADSQFNFLLSQLEKRTAQPGLFQTADSKKTTATRDVIVDENSKVRQGLEVSAVISAFSEALNLLLEQYQYFAPPTMGTRVLGKDGKKLFDDFKPADILGRYDIKIAEDIVGGNRAFKANLAMKRLEIGLQDPFVKNNANGMWQLFNDTYRDLGIDNPDKYQAKQPPSDDKISDEVEDEFFRMQQGDEIDPPEGKSAQALVHLQEHTKQRIEQAYQLDEKALEELDRHILITMKNVQDFQQEMQNEQISNELALNSGGMDDSGMGTVGQGSVEGVPGGVPEQRGAIPVGSTGNSGAGETAPIVQ
jgi:hypothetical protein